MGTKVVDIPTAAGVECPKKMGAMDQDEPCTKCRHYAKCWGVILGVLEEVG